MNSTQSQQSKGRLNRGLVSKLLVSMSITVHMVGEVKAQVIPMQNATATFSQVSFGGAPVARAIDGNLGSNNGWAIYEGPSSDNSLPNMTNPQTAVFETVSNFSLPGGTRLSFTLHQKLSAANPHTLGRFRLSATTDARTEFADGLGAGGDVTANWVVLEPLSVSATNGLVLSILEDSSILAGGPNPATSVYTVTADTALSGITGFRIEVLADPSLPHMGPGRALENGNFALTEFQAAVVSRPPVAHYRFDESSGPTAFDSVGAFNGTLSPSGATFTAGGISGNAISLDRAAGGFVNMGTSFPGFLTGDYSLVLWVKTTTTEVDTIAIGKHTAGSENGYFVHINPTGGGGVANKANFVASSFTSLGATSSTTVNDGAWHQIVGVYQSGGNESIYVDGVPLESTNGAKAMIASTAPFMIGGINTAGTPTARYTGLIDEVQVYDHALTDTAISYLFQNPSQAIQTLGPLTLTRDGAGFRLTWPGNGILQTNNTLSGLWTDVNGGMATSPFLIPTPSDRDFFRLRN